MSEVEPTEPVATPAAIDKEVVVLRTALDMIRAMVNLSIFGEVITSRDTTSSSITLHRWLFSTSFWRLPIATERVVLRAQS